MPRKFSKWWFRGSTPIKAIGSNQLAAEPAGEISLALTGSPVPFVQGRKSYGPMVRVNGKFEAVFCPRVYQAIETRLWDSSIEPIPAGRDARPADQTRRDFPASPRCFGYVSRMTFSANHWEKATYKNS